MLHLLARHVVELYRDNQIFEGVGGGAVAGAQLLRGLARPGLDVAERGQVGECVSQALDLFFAERCDGVDRIFNGFDQLGSCVKGGLHFGLNVLRQVSHVLRQRPERGAYVAKA